MSLPIQVDAYYGYKANERLSQFVLDETDLPNRRCARSVVRTYGDVLQSEDGRRQTYLLRYDEETDEWTLQSGF